MNRVVGLVAGHTLRASVAGVRSWARVMLGDIGSGLPAFARSLVRRTSTLAISAASLSACASPGLAPGVFADQGSVALETSQVQHHGGATAVLSSVPTPPSTASATLTTLEFSWGKAQLLDTAQQAWVTQGGDHFWMIAEHILGEAWGQAPTRSQTDAYWRRLVDDNRSRLVVGDNPDLIYPGQRFALPEVGPR